MLHILIHRHDRMLPPLRLRLPRSRCLIRQTPRSRRQKPDPRLPRSLKLSERLMSLGQILPFVAAMPPRRHQHLRPRCQRSSNPLHHQRLLASIQPHVRRRRGLPLGPSRGRQRRHPIPSPLPPQIPSPIPRGQIPPEDQPLWNSSRGLLRGFRSSFLLRGNMRSVLVVHTLRICVHHRPQLLLHMRIHQLGILSLLKNLLHKPWIVSHPI
mmetsp:Transcript_34812/g.42002  ORF Transcript_34812/g.42002 Transcript_34812/m.42002 type:complete len:211 (+) Transcript_34812:218-850(+)